ncbi:Ascorbate transporter, chloroplastic [Armadillidium nasatum]|uniref:Ascorbate transporter, chloroplastic n=1 Tax=Armadillidium nasatum TaxID=96803 RepID=A0A5N5TA92_9CRUS|nr:Ascorbate transporter, chloroplastic [Armadillidium nasatum]
MKFQWRSLGYKTKLIILCSIANFINAADRVLMPIAIISMTREYKWNLSIQGWILSAFAFGYFTSQVLCANAGNKYGGKKVLCFAVFLWSVSTIATPLCASYLPLLITARVILGLGEGLGLPTIFQLFAQHIPPEQRSRAFGYMLAAGSVGQTIASLFIPHVEWKLSFEIFGSMGLLWVACWLFTYHDPPSQTDEEAQLIPSVKNEGESLCIARLEWISHWCLWAVYIAHFAMNWSNYIIMQWLPTYLSRTLGANTESMSLTAIPYIVSSFCGIAWGHLADQLVTVGWPILKVRKLMTLLGLAGPGICLVFFPEVSNLLVAVLVISMAMGLCAANSSGHLSNHADFAPNHAGITFAVSNTLATIPGILCGPLTAELVTASGGRWFPVFLLAGTINFTASIIYYTQSSTKPIL